MPSEHRTPPRYHSADHSMSFAINHSTLFSAGHVLIVKRRVKLIITLASSDLQSNISLVEGTCYCLLLKFVSFTTFCTGFSTATYQHSVNYRRNATLGYVHAWCALIVTLSFNIQYIEENNYVLRRGIYLFNKFLILNQ